MLKHFFPKAYKRYLSLPVLGSTLGKFSEFLTNLGYPKHIVRSRLRATVVIDKRLRQHKCYLIKKITRSTLRSCAPPPGRSQEDIEASASVKLLERYFDQQGIFPSPEPPTPIQNKIIEYRHYLQKVRGFSISTVHHHCLTVSQFLMHFNKRGELSFLPKLTSLNIEDFIRDSGDRVKRGTLQHIVAHLRAFLKFLIAHGEIKKRLDMQIDTPRVYREEQLPRSLDWETVQTLLPPCVSIVVASTYKTWGRKETTNDAYIRRSKASNS